jgi:hypothetical protein
MTNFSLDGLAPDGSSPFPGVIGLSNCRVNGTKALETLLELGRETLVCFGLR